jgi:hypothetical protein
MFVYCPSNGVTYEIAQKLNTGLSLRGLFLFVGSKKKRFFTNSVGNMNIWTVTFYNGKEIHFSVKTVGVLVHGSVHGNGKVTLGALDFCSPVQKDYVETMKVVGEKEMSDFSEGRKGKELWSEPEIFPCDALHFPMAFLV